jgi:hypothetical protein
MVDRVRRRRTRAGLGALALVGRKVVIPQEARSRPNNRRGKIQRTRERCTVVAATKAPFWVETARARQQFVVEESRRQRRSRRIDVHIAVVLVRDWPGKWIGRSGGTGRQDG